MPLTYSLAVVDAKNEALETAVGASPKLRIYSGAMPTNARTALAGNTLIAEGTLPADWLAASATGVKNKAGTWTLTGQAGAGTGTAGTFYRIYDNAGTTCHVQGTFTATGGGGDLTVDNNSIANAQSVTVNTYSITGGNLG